MCNEPTIDISEARKQLSSLGKRLSVNPVIFVTRHNKRAFAIVDVQHIETMTDTLEIMSDPDAYEMFRKSVEDIRHGRLHDHEEIENRLG